MEVKDEFISCQICANPARVKLECGCQLCGPCSLYHSSQHPAVGAPPATRPPPSPVLRMVDRMIARVKEETTALESVMFAQRQDLVQQVSDLFKGVSEKLWSHCDETVQTLDQVREDVEEGRVGEIAAGLEQVSRECCSWTLPSFVNFELPLWVQRAVEKSGKYVSQVTFSAEDVLKKWVKVQTKLAAAPTGVFPVLFSNFLFEYSLNSETVSQTVLESTPHINGGTSCTLLSTNTLFCSGGKYHSKVYTLVDNHPCRLLNMKHSRAYSGQTVGDGCVYVFGGTQWDLSLTSAEKYDLTGKKWRSLPDMDQAMCRFNPVIHRNVVYLIGCYSRVTVFYTTSETYGQSSMSLPVAKPSLAILHDSTIYVLQDASLHVWNLQLERCSPPRPIPPMGQAWSRTSPVRLDGSVLFSSDFDQSVYSLDLSTLRVTLLGSLSV